MKNQSEFYVHATKDGVTESFAPGDDIPSWVKVDNPYVSGKKDSEDEAPVDEPKAAAVDDDADDAAPKPRRGRARS
ncbi:hypothetical protein [Mycobacterium colombiense]